MSSECVLSKHGKAFRRKGGFVFPRFFLCSKQNLLRLVLNEKGGGFAVQSQHQVNCLTDPYMIARVKSGLLPVFIGNR